ncbi:MAG: reverse transcriptase-like protein [Sphaerimonospora mesophila]
MKQKVVVRAIVPQRGRVLLIRRSGGRPSIDGLYELPGGSLHRNEQPVDALKRSLQIHTGIYPEIAYLREVVSYTDPEDRELQYIFILYEVSLSERVPRVSLDNEYDHYIWKSLSDIQQNVITNSTTVLLDISADKGAGKTLVLDDNDDKNTTLLIYSDGGSRGNPGPSASAFVIMDQHENIVTQGGDFIGRSDSGMAEYTAVELALQKALEINARRIEFRSDSLMVVNQLNGLFSVKNPEYREVYDRIKRLMTRFDKIRFRHVHREYNRLADGLVNKILDDNRS